MAGAPIGNQNARQAAQWREALRRALARVGSTVETGLDKCADQLVKAAVSGKPWALEHIAERLDGRAVQHVSATVEHTVVTGDTESLAGRLATARRQDTKHPIQ